MKKSMTLLFACLVPVIVFSQQDDFAGRTENPKALNLFMDCGYCDLDYFRSEFTIVNYVNDYHDADVHILVTTLPLGGGGTSY